MPNTGITRNTFVLVEIKSEDVYTAVNVIYLDFQKASKAFHRTTLRVNYTNP